MFLRSVFGFLGSFGLYGWKIFKILFNDVLDIWYVVVYICNWVRIDLFFMFFVLCLDFVLLFKISIFVVFIGILSVLLLYVINVLFFLYKLFLVIFIILFFVLYWFGLLVIKLYLMGCVMLRLNCDM